MKVPFWLYLPWWLIRPFLTVFGCILGLCVLFPTILVIDLYCGARASYRGETYTPIMDL